MTHNRPSHEDDWVHGHAHDPNLLPPAGDGRFVVCTPQGEELTLSISDLAALPYTEVEECLIVSTGHGTSGPFTFGGASLADLLTHLLREAVGHPDRRQVDVISTDGFGTRLAAVDLAAAPPILLAYRRNGQLLTRDQGLVRLIVPSERDDALRQVKWIARIEVT